MIYWYDTLESTNNYAKEHIEDFDNLSVIVAKCQSKGRGQGDHSWLVEPGKNMTFTVIIKPDADFSLDAKNTILITHLTTRAIRRFLSGYGIKTRIKWPNDIYVEDKKICGILIENILKGHDVKVSMIGVGINLNQTIFPAELPNPVSVKQITGSESNLEQSISDIAACFAETYELAKTPQGRLDLKREFERDVFYLQ